MLEAAKVMGGSSSRGRELWEVKGKNHLQWPWMVGCGDSVKWELVTKAVFWASPNRPALKHYGEGDAVGKGVKSE